MKLVEVIRGYATSDSTCTEVMELSSQRQGARGSERLPGFVANHPDADDREAILTLYEGWQASKKLIR